jgi:hypothetical protein
VPILSDPPRHRLQPRNGAARQMEKLKDTPV